MKQKTNARQKREAEALRRKGVFSPNGGAKPAAFETKAKQSPASLSPAVPHAVEPRTAPVPSVPSAPQKTPEEEAKEFLDYLDRYGVPAEKEELFPGRKTGGLSSGIPRLNLEEGMPVVSEALDRLRIGLQETRVRQAKAVKLIHGYGSTGRGGKICSAVRAELAAMKKRKQIRDYIPGEDFGPVDAASRKLAERNRNVTRDPDYGRINHGITIVVL